jgi:hydroxymethylbilane synthase
MANESPSPLRIGSRGSRLALWQAEHVRALLGRAAPGQEVRLVTVKTTGDRILDAPLSRIGDKGLFTKELEAALLEREIDVAVHSLKDLPTKLPPELAIGAIIEREDPRDALIGPAGKTLASLPAGARIGTSSLRRRAQILALRADLVVEDLRGNVPTRIEKLGDGKVDAIVLARAGLVRLGLDSRITEVLPPDRMLPAVGQGAIALQTRREDLVTARLIAPLEHVPTRLAVTAERALLSRLEGGCQVPIGALATWEGSSLVLRGLVADLDGGSVVRSEAAADLSKEPGAASESHAAALGDALAERLLELGAGPILARIYEAAGRRGAEPPLLGDGVGE